MIPEQTFFPDPALDRAFGVVMALAAEVWVLKDRVAGLEAQEADGVLEPGYPNWRLPWVVISGIKKFP